MLDVVALGELLIDFTCISADADGYPTMAAHPGGAPANYLAAVTKFGGKTAMLGKVGTDAFGKLLTGTLEKAGIDTRGLIATPDVFTTLAFVTLDETGNREFSFARKPGADTCIGTDEVRYDLLDETKVLHFGTLSLTDGPARSATYAAVEYCREHGKLISFDPNLRKPLWRDLEEAKKQMLWGLAHADVVKISDEEVDFLWGLSPQESAQKLLTEYGASLVYVTLGPKGCYFANRNCTGEIASPAEIHVVDTTGAGDIFGGSAMSRFLKLNKAPADLTKKELTAITTFACCAASLSTQKHGGITSVVPEAEVRERIARMVQA